MGQIFPLHCALNVLMIHFQSVLQQENLPRSTSSWGSSSPGWIRLCRPSTRPKKSGKILITSSKVPCYFLVVFFIWYLKFSNINVEHQSKLRNVENLDNARLGKLKTDRYDTYQAVMWLRENRHRFRAPIHEPPVLSVSVHFVSWVF